GKGSFLTICELIPSEVINECTLYTLALHFLSLPWLHTLDTAGTQGIGRGYTAFLENCNHLGSCCGSILAHLPKVQHGWPSAGQTFQRLKQILHINFRKIAVERLRKGVAKQRYDA